MTHTRTITVGLRGAAVAFFAVAALALAGCTEDVSPLDAARADVSAKEKAVTDAEAAFALAVGAHGIASKNAKAAERDCSEARAALREAQANGARV